MVCHPEVQRKAQMEMDSVLPPGHLPDFSDEQALPYLSAIVKEVIRYVVKSYQKRRQKSLNLFSRWQPAVPIGLVQLLRTYFLYSKM